MKKTRSYDILKSYIYDFILPETKEKKEKNFMNVALIGATHKPHRYAYKALHDLRKNNYTVYPVHAKLKAVEQIPVYPSITAIPEKIHTVTLYVNKEKSTAMVDEIISKNPKRIIFNPGAENPFLEKQAKQHGIQTLNACTLVMLKTGAF